MGAGYCVHSVFGDPRVLPSVDVPIEEVRVGVVRGMKVVDFWIAQVAECSKGPSLKHQ